MKKKLLSLMLCVVMVAAIVCALVACEEEDYDYKITVWVGEGMKDLTAQQIKTFNETNEWGIKFKATIEIVSESKAVGDAVQKPASCADIFCFAQDTLARAVTGNLLQTLNSDSVAAIEANNEADSIAAATIGDYIRAFPMTADNGYFMYYDKRVITDDVDKTSLEALLDACGNAGKKFAMLLEEDGGWYAASFFYAAGAKSEWVTDEDGFFTNYTDTFADEEGLIALQGMQKILKHKAHIESDKAATFSAGIPSAVVISGIWDYNTALSALGEQNLGIAPLPSYEVNGEHYQLKSYLGHKLMGVKTQSDGYKSYYLQALASYLTSEECQLQRFQQKHWGPANKNLKTRAEILQFEALNVLRTNTVAQGQYPTEWWADLAILTGSAHTSNSDLSSLQALLDQYDSNLSKYLKK